MQRSEITVSIVSGVYNEIGNIGKFVENLKNDEFVRCYPNLKKLILVDDGSTDGTLEAIKSMLSENLPFRIILIERCTKFGLVDAFLTGSKDVDTEYTIFMDCDMQHPVSLIEKLIETAQNGFDIVVASRYVEGGGTDWSPLRGIISRCAIALSWLILPGAKKIKDSTSGFFIVNTAMLRDLKKFPGFYKLLLYILSQNYETSVAEVPFKIVGRKQGESKIVNHSFKFIIMYLKELLTYRFESNKVRAHNLPERND